jgi:hypothetical protein
MTARWNGKAIAHRTQPTLGEACEPRSESVINETRLYVLTLNGTVNWTYSHWSNKHGLTFTPKPGIKMNRSTKYGKCRAALVDYFYFKVNAAERVERVESEVAGELET